MSVNVDDIYIRPALANEAAEITELGLQSKAHWGYDQAFMQACRQEMQHVPADIESSQSVYRVATIKGTLVGFYKLEDINSPRVTIDALFIDPTMIGHGVGRLLIEHAKEIAIKRGASFLVAQSDPFAESFYLAMGAELVGQLESGSIAGRFLPLVEIALSNHN